MSWFSSLDPILQAFLASVFTWSMTMVGAAFVFGFKSVHAWLSDLMMGFAAGVMIAASVWSLLIPSIEQAEADGVLPWLPALQGFQRVDCSCMHWIECCLTCTRGSIQTTRMGIKTEWSRSALLVGAITLHNIPEGLAVGVAFGAAAYGEGATTAAALVLALGIGIQNLPEGTAVALPLRGLGMSRAKSFFFGQLSAVVEPIAAVIGAAAVVFARPVLPYVMAFAAGAMVYVVVEDVIPQSQRGKHNDLATGGAMVGFALMMVLDVALG